MKEILYVCASLLLAEASIAQTSELYLNDWMNTNCYVVQNGQIVRQFARTDEQDGPGLVVHATVKMYGQLWGGVGREYDYTGNLLSGQYPNPFWIDCFDGATDGKRNWTIAANDPMSRFPIMLADADWQDIDISFQTPGRRFSGIAYDFTDDTLWLASMYGDNNKVAHYTTDGERLFQFPIATKGFALALDPADQTLWVPGTFATAGMLFQYEKSGNLLQVVNVPGLSTNVFGAEFYGVSPYQRYCDSYANSSGGAALIYARGHNSITTNDLTLVAEPVPDQFCFFLHGTDKTQVPFGNGFLCLTGSVTRLQPPVVAVGNTATFDLNLSGFSPGTLHFQCWFRDPQGGGAKFDTSDAVSITLAP